MPLVEPDAIQAATATAKAKQSRRAARAGGGDADAITPISEAQMLNLPQSQTIHTLPLVFRCLPMKSALELQQKIYDEWPDLFLYAAVGERDGAGISLPVVLEMWETARQNAVALAPDAPVPPPVTRQDVTQQLQVFAENAPSLVPTLAETLWPLVSSTPGLRWPRPALVEGQEPEPLPEGVEYLDDAILQRFSVPALTDLLRAALDCLGGFPGDAGDRFL